MLQYKHFYPRDRRYRLTTTYAVYPGDIARCGYVKVTPRRSESELPRCPRCAAHRAQHGRNLPDPCPPRVP